MAWRIKQWGSGGMAAGTGVAILLATATPAEAQYYRRPHYAPGAALGLGSAGGILAGSALAAAARPQPEFIEEPVRVYRPAPRVVSECWTETRRVWDGYGYVRQRVEICD
ncbi:MAG: hypothetical protein ACRCUX_15070 [Beijerinckiaceae bacterium]